MQSNLYPIFLALLGVATCTEVVVGGVNGSGSVITASETRVITGMAIGARGGALGADGLVGLSTACITAAGNVASNVEWLTALANTGGDPVASALRRVSRRAAPRASAATSTRKRSRLPV